MIAFLEGKIEYIFANSIVIVVAGVGYECFVSTSTISSLNIGDNTKVYTHMVVREDDMSLYGFLNLQEKSIFLKLLSISGVGAKIALQVLSGLSAGRVIEAIALGDVAALSSIKGIGKKTAERIVVELKDKIASDFVSAGGGFTSSIIQNSSASEAAAALVSLGYSNLEASRYVEKVKDKDNLSVEQIIVLALKG